jgi:Beta-galactosidase
MQRSVSWRRTLQFAGLVLWASLVLAPANIQAAPAQTSLRPWQDYRTIMWINDPVHGKPAKAPLFFRRLRQMGVNTGMVFDDGDNKLLVENHFPYYVENMVNRGLCLKWNSSVRDWDKFVTDWSRTGRPASALVRDYCLDDPTWQRWAREEVSRIVRKNRVQAPLAYNIRDELSTTFSANPFDYDFNPLTLAKFRAWLQTQYHTLGALNAEWDTRFRSWETVRPFTTDQIKNRLAGGGALPRGNPDWQRLERMRFDPGQARQSPVRWDFAPWCDFRSYMDLSLARTLNSLRQTARALDPRTPVGIEGTQMPDAFGGYDLWRLAHALDWVEAYDIGDAREIFGSFMPGKPILTTVFESDTRHARRRLWHLLLEGDRGCIVWWSEDCIDWKSEDYALTAKAKAIAPALKEMTSPLARLFLRATPERDPIYIHYSQPSIQVDWLLESTGDGSTWLRRFSSFEAGHNRQAKVRDGWLKALEDLGYSPQFISSEQIESGKLRRVARAGSAVLVLPSSWAVSGKEASEIKRLVAPSAGGAPEAIHALFCDGAPGQFDQHGKLWEHSPLDPLCPPPGVPEPRCFVAKNGRFAALRKGDIGAYSAERLKPQPDAAWPDWIAGQLRGMPPEVSVPSSTRVRIHRFKVKWGRLVAFERNISYQMSEDLKQAGGNEALEQPITLEARLEHPAHVYDLRSRAYLGYTDRVHFTLDPWQPSLFALTPQKVRLEKLLRR